MHLSPYIAEVASADTAAHAFSAQSVETPILIFVSPAATGTVTIDDGASGGVILGAGKTGIFWARDLSKLRYTFSVNAATEKFGISAGV